MPELPTKGELVASEFTVHMTSCGPHVKEPTSAFDSPQYDALARVVRFFEDAEIALGDLAHRGGSERRTRGQLGTMEQQLIDLPQRLEERVVPRFEHTERAIDETTERQRDKEYSDGLSPEHLDKRYPIGSVELRTARLEAAARKCDDAKRQRTLNPHGGTLMAQPPRAGLPPNRASALNPLLRFSSSPTRIVTLPPAVPRLNEPCSSALVTTNGGASWRPAVASIGAPAPSGDSSGAFIAAAPSPPSAGKSPQRQPSAANRTAAVMRLQDMPGGFPQLLRVWETSIAPHEREGTAWRSEKAPPVGVGLKEAQRVKDLINRSYLPALYAMMARVENGATRQEAAAELQRDKGAKDISKFIKELSPPDADAKARYRAMLFEVATATGTPDHQNILQVAAASVNLDSPSWEPMRVILNGDHADTSVTPSTQPSAVAPSALSSAAASSTASAATTRYLALDPALSCGWAVVHVQDANVVQVDIGIAALEGDCMGARGVSLQRQLLPLLASPPTHAFIEKFCGAAPRGDDVNHGLRAAIEMLLFEHGIRYTMVAQQTWKAFLGAGKGMRGKEKKERKDAVVAAVEAKLGSSFPADVPIGSKTLSFRDDASDAAAIALWGVNEMLGDAVSWTEPVPITAPPLASSTQAGTKRANESQGAAPSAKRVS